MNAGSYTSPRPHTYHHFHQQQQEHQAAAAAYKTSMNASTSTTGGGRSAGQPPHVIPLSRQSTQSAHAHQPYSVELHGQANSQSQPQMFSQSPAAYVRSPTQLHTYSPLQRHAQTQTQTQAIASEGRPHYEFPASVVMTNTINFTRDTKNNMVVNQYLVGHRLGKGQHGEVFKGYDMARGNMLVAIKACRRKNLRESQAERLRQNANNALPRSTAVKGIGVGGIGRTRLVDQLQSAEKKVLREIAIMKKCKHGQIVQLLEVIDDRLTSKIFMVMEYMGGGEVKWRDTTGPGAQPVLTVDQSRRITRDVVLGLEYLHHQGIIHRDIKPANLLWTADRKNVKITDFGVSHFSYAQRLSAVRASDAYKEERERQREVRAKRKREEEAERERRAIANVRSWRGRGWDAKGKGKEKDIKGKGKAHGSSSSTPWDSASTTPGDTTPATSVLPSSLALPPSAPPSASSHAGDNADGDDAEADAEDDAAVLARLAGAPDPILLDDSGLSRQAGTPSFLAPEIVWEFRRERQEALRKRAGVGGLGFGSGSGAGHSDEGGGEARMGAGFFGGTRSRSASASDVGGDGDGNGGVGGENADGQLPSTPSRAELEIEQTPRPPVRAEVEVDETEDGTADSPVEVGVVPPSDHSAPSSSERGDGEQERGPVGSVHLGETHSTVPDPNPNPPRSPSVLSDAGADLDGEGEEPKPKPPITQAIDVWALGVTLYCLLHGRVPWSAASEFAMYQQLHARDFAIGETMGFDRISTGGRTHAPDDMSEGGVVVRLLERLLEKDCTKRITLGEVKRLPWITRDIPNPEAWLHETSPVLHDPINVTPDDESDAMSLVKFRWGGSGILGRIRSLFPGRRRSATATAAPGAPKLAAVRLETLRDEDEGDVALTDSELPRAIAASVQRAPSRGERVARAAVDVAAGAARKISRHNNSVPTTFGTATASTRTDVPRKRRTLPDLVIGFRDRSRSRSRPGSRGQSREREGERESRQRRFSLHSFRSRSGPPTPRAQSSSNLTSPITPDADGEGGYTSDDILDDSILDEDDEQALYARRERLARAEREQEREKQKARSRLSFFRLGVGSGSSRSNLAENNSGSPVAKKGKKSGLFVRSQPTHLARRSADGFNLSSPRGAPGPGPSAGMKTSARSGSGPAYAGMGLASSTGELTSAMRAASWGEVADEYAVEEFDMLSDYDNVSMNAGADEDMMMIGAGGVLSPTSGPSSPNSLSGISVSQHQHQPPEGFWLPNASVNVAVSSSDGEQLISTGPGPISLALPLIQSQGEWLLRAGEVPLVADPALQEGTGHRAVRQRTSHHHHLSSPLAQTPYSMDDEDSNVSRFDEEYVRSHAQPYNGQQDGEGVDGDEESDESSIVSGEHVYGQGATFLDDDEVEGGSSSDEEEPPRLEIRRRRPSETVARS